MSSQALVILISVGHPFYCAAQKEKAHAVKHELEVTTLHFRNIIGEFLSLLSPIRLHVSDNLIGY